MFIAAASVAAACGARTALDVPEEGGLPDVVRDARRDVEPDADAGEEDALPPIDAIVPDVPVPTDCPDAGSTLIYVIGSNNELFSFYPPTLSFTMIGTVACTKKSDPFSMAVDRLGTAYSVFSDGELFKISTANAACLATTYMPSQLGWTNFGMSYASGADGGDQLFVIEVDFKQPSMGLGTIDTNAFTLSEVGTFTPDLTSECELTGTGDGRLFALCLPTSGSGSTLAQIDPTTANIIGEDQLTTGGPQEALAFAFWGGEFYIFTSPGTTTTVTKYDPVAKTETVVASLGAQIVGAGVSTCAPQ
jgi:hypothetical protein